MKCSSSRLVAALIETSVGATVALFPEKTRLAAQLHPHDCENEGTPGATRGHEILCISAFQIPPITARCISWAVRLVNIFLVTRLLLFS
jgi:hypothetical protein